MSLIVIGGEVRQGGEDLVPASGPRSATRPGRGHHFWCGDTVIETSEGVAAGITAGGLAGAGVGCEVAGGGLDGVMAGGFADAGGGVVDGGLAGIMAGVW
jgi:hypothetical protein